MRTLTFLFTGVLIMAFPLVSHGQTDPHDDPKVIPPSPTVASLMKFADIPVGLYTGVASVNIPLYELKGSHLSLPISLSYHAGGIRVEEQSSWVGLGWALNAGGAISRTAKGLRDEAHGGYITSSSLPADPQIEDFFTEVINGNLDTEPDIFFFNFNGRSGKFYLDKKPSAGNVVNGYSIPYQDIRIKCTYAPDILSNFSITTEDGVEYFFDVLEVTDSKRYQYDVSSSIAGPVLIDAPPPLSQITSWYLKEIRSPIGDETIVFNYIAEKSKYETTRSGRASYDAAGRIRSRTMSYNEITSNTWRLSTITFTRIGATVDFVAGDDRIDLLQIKSAKSLSQIVIKYGAVPVKRFELSTSYFIHPMAGQEMQDKRYQFRRLRLDKVTEQTGDQSESLPPYVFTYNNIPLPPKNAETQDHWGYYNGPADPLNIYSYYSTSYMIPGYSGQVDNNQDKFVYYECTGDVTTVDLNGNVYLDFDGANREPNAMSMKAGILTQVRYPMGGTTTLDYGPHYFGYVSDKDTTRNIYNQYVPGAYIERPWQNNPTVDEVKENVFVAPKTGVYRISFEVEFGYKDKDDYENGVAYNRNEVRLLRTDGGYPILKVYWDYDGSRGDLYIERTPEGTAYAGAVRLSNFTTFSEVNFAEISDTGGDFENYGRRSGRGFMTVRLTGGVSYKFVANRKYNRETYCLASNDPGCITNNNLATINFDRPLDSREIIGMEKSFMAGGLQVLRKTEAPAFGGTPVVTNYSYQMTDDAFKPTDRSSGCLLTVPDHTNAEAFINYQEVQQALDGRRVMDACTENTTYIYTLFSVDSDYYMPLSTTQGSHLSYREVTVSQSGNGYTISKFKSGYDHPDQYPKELTIVIKSPGFDKTGSFQLNSAYESRFRNMVPKENREEVVAGRSSWQG